MKYTIGHIQDLYDYLQYNVKHNFLDEDIVEDIIDRQDWKEAERLRELGDFYANENENN